MARQGRRTRPGKRMSSTPSPQKKEKTRTHPRTPKTHHRLQTSQDKTHTTETRRGSQYCAVQATRSLIHAHTHTHMHSHAYTCTGQPPSCLLTSPPNTYTRIQMHPYACNFPPLAMQNRMHFKMHSSLSWGEIRGKKNRTPPYAHIH